MSTNTQPLQSAGASFNVFSIPAVSIPVLVSILLLFSTLNSGLMRDDYLHRALLMGEEVLPGLEFEAFGPVDAAMHLFSFSSKNLDMLPLAKEYGNVPWWTDDELHVNFWRPLAALTHWFDYQLWPDMPWLMHLHSLLWYLALGLLLGKWLQSLRVQGLALWVAMSLYMLDASHIHAIGWLANRNILIATCFGLLSLIQLRRWSRFQSVLDGKITEQSNDGSPTALMLSLLFFALALLSAEAGVSLFGIVTAYLLVLDKHGWQKKLAAFFTFALLVIGWRLIYSSLGYGAHHSGFYLDPINSTASFLESLFINGPIMLYEQMVRVPSLSMLMSPAVELNQVMVSVVVLLIAALIFLPVIRKPLGLFAVLAAVFSMPPACATVVTGGRLMFFFGIGICILLGLWVEALRNKSDSLPANKAYRGVAYLWSLVLLVAISAGTGFLWYSKVSSAFGPEKPPFTAYTNVIKDLEKDQILIVVNPPVLFEQMYLPLKADYFGLQVPQKMLMLAPGLTAFELTQTTENSWVLENDHGLMIAPLVDFYQDDLPQSDFAFLFRRVDSFFNATTSDLSALQSVTVAGVSIAVDVSTPEGDPKRVSVQFPDTQLGNRYRFITWNWQEKQYQLLQPETDMQKLPKTTRILGPF
ncbi:MAG: hypothetical protein MI976_00015 [Pseudomonadales bacterium]|nr:hypothetical protein [Pseudomonadales bacterium]